MNAGGLPSWRRSTDPEPHWPVAVGVLAAVVLQVTLPDRLAIHPRLALPALEVGAFLVLLVANPGRITHRSRRLQGLGIALVVLIVAANAWSIVQLVLDLVDGRDFAAAELLRVGGAVWFTNVIAFALVYWEADRGGPVARAQGRPDQAPDFLFPQMATPDIAAAGWEAQFVDYLFTSFTNATAFSPTDVLPLSRWAKLAMMAQASVSLGTVALVVARAVNILR